MAGSAKSALVLQGGGALGAHELGAARALYKVPKFSPDLIAGVSIGAVTAVLLARAKDGMTPLKALDAFWEKVTVPRRSFRGWFALTSPFSAIPISSCRDTIT